MAYGYATSMFICENENFEGTWFECYEHIAKYAKGDDPNGELKGWNPWQPFETRSWETIVEYICEEAAAIHTLLEEALEHAKRGIVTSVIDGSLGDVAQLDMEHMVEKGAAK